MASFDVDERLRSAFPPLLRGTMGAVTELLRNGAHEPTAQDIGIINVNGDSVRIPHRIYCEVPATHTLSIFPETQRLAAACLLTRHHDGFVRQRFARQFEGQLRPWVLPFAIQLLAEYVHAIAADLLSVFPTQPVSTIHDFTSQNPDYLATTRRRIVSYWHCNSDIVPRFTSYAPYRIMERLGLWDHRLTPKLTARRLPG